ncbi:MAG TPA: hypothetical protein PLG79_12145 [Spirochaetales bacterium]|nr:hypothetical protein [Spirochaetales bacterium]
MGIAFVGFVPGIFYNLETVGVEYEAGNPLRLDVIGPPKTPRGSFQNDCLLVSDAKVLTGCQKPLEGVDLLVVEMTSAQGYQGMGFSYALRYGGEGQYAHDKELCPLVMGEDPNDITKIWYKLMWAGASVGRSGIAIQAIAAFDTALWDMKAKRANPFLAKLIGAHYDSLPIYKGSRLKCLKKKRATQKAQEFFLLTFAKSVDIVNRNMDRLHMVLKEVKIKDNQKGALISRRNFPGIRIFLRLLFRGAVNGSFFFIPSLLYSLCLIYDRSDRSSLNLNEERSL